MAVFTGRYVSVVYPEVRQQPFFLIYVVIRNCPGCFSVSWLCCIGYYIFPSNLIGYCVEHRVGGSFKLWVIWVLSEGVNVV